MPRYRLVSKLTVEFDEKDGPSAYRFHEHFLAWLNEKVTNGVLPTTDVTLELERLEGAEKKEIKQHILGNYSPTLQHYICQRCGERIPTGGRPYDRECRA